MIVFEITNGKESFEYKLPEKASEFTLDKLIRYEETVVSKKPDSMKKLEAMIEESDRSDYLNSLNQDEENKWLTYYLKEVQFFTDMSLEHLQLIPMRSEDGFDIIDLKNCIDRALLNRENRMIESFDIGPDRFFLPTAPANIFDATKKDFMRDSTVGEYSTALELKKAFEMIEEKRTLGLCHFMAVLCKKKDEKFPVFPSEQTDFIKERAELFRQLDYDTAMNVSFFLISQELNLLEDSQFSKALKLLHLNLRCQRLTAHIYSLKRLQSLALSTDLT